MYSARAKISVESSTIDHAGRGNHSALKRLVETRERETSLQIASQRHIHLGMSLILAGTGSEAAVVLYASATARSTPMGPFVLCCQQLGSDSEKGSVMRGESLGETGEERALLTVWDCP